MIWGYPYLWKHPYRLMVMNLMVNRIRKQKNTTTLYYIYKYIQGWFPCSDKAPTLGPTFSGDELPQRLELFGCFS